MYAGVAGEDQRETALASARTLDGRWIDAGNSRSYRLAWLVTVQT